MEFLFIVGIVFLLYAKTMNYFYLIDDFLKRESYYNYGIVTPPVQIFFMKPSQMYRVFMIGMHVVNCWIIYLLWGFYAALLFAIHPMAVWGVAWVTGNYYSTATFFTLVSYYILHQFPNVWGALVAMPIFNAAINSTVCPMAFPFLFIFEPWLACLGIMVYWFLKSDRWATAMKVRNELNQNPVTFDWKRPILMVKVVARYTFEAIWPVKTIMFANFGGCPRDDKREYEELHKCDAHFWSGLILILSVIGLGLIVDKFSTAWFFIIIALHSQFGLTGQFYAQRYLYLPLIGMCVLLAKVGMVLPWLMAIYIVYILYRTIKSIPKFSDMLTFYRHDLKMSPDYDMAYLNLANYISKTTNDMVEIEALFKKALSVNDKQWATHFNLGKMYIIQKKYDLALEHIKKAIPLATFTPTINMLKFMQECLEKQRVIGGDNIENMYIEIAKKEADRVINTL